MDTNLNNPLVSILVATYNRANLIGIALASVQKQSYKNWELIVIDDASTDDTQKIVASFIQNDPRIRYVRQAQNVGIARNRNTGLTEAKGEFVAVLDSDDIWTDTDKLAKQVAFLQKNTETAAVGTFVSVIDAKGLVKKLVRYQISDSGIRSHLFRRNQFAQSSIMYRKAAVQAVGGYDATYTVNDDYDLWLKLGRTSKLANLPEFTAGYRVHAGGITKTKRLKAAKEHLAIMKAHKKSYPRYALGVLKAYLRILLATIGL
jgi:glycosyltransferase involved in cell wall biosynthesis